MLREIEEYERCIEEATSYGVKIARKILKVLRKYDKTASYSIGWAEGGVDTICFYTRKNYAIRTGDEYLGYVIEEAIPELKNYVDCPFGFWVDKETAKKIREELKELRLEEFRGR